MPVLMPTFGLLDWNKGEIVQIDIRTRNLLCMTGNFHRNSDVDRFYVQRKKGCRGLKSIQVAYETRIISTRQHLRANEKGNKYLENMTNHEQDKVMRVDEELLRSVEINDDHQLKPRAISQRYLQNILQTKQESYQNKQLHGYIQRKVSDNPNIDQSASKEWMTNKYITSHFEAYACAIQEQEIGKEDLIYRRERKNNHRPKSDNKCRLCKSQVEDIAHVVSSCPKMSS